MLVGHCHFLEASINIEGTTMTYAVFHKPILTTWQNIFGKGDLLKTCLLVFMNNTFPSHMPNPNSEIKD